MQGQVKSLVSIIMIFLNEEQFIQEAIDSVIAQTSPFWELLLVDDGSTDNSTIIAQTYAAQYPETIYYFEHHHHQNQGMSASRNLGIHHARGEYIAFLDADDVWLPHKLEQQITIMKAYPAAALVCGRTQWWYSWTGHPEDKHRDFLQRFDLPLNQLIQPPNLLTLFLRDEWASLCDVLVRRDIVEAVGGYEPSFRGMYEDQVFHAKLCLQWPAYLSSQSWYRYRQHPEACCTVSHTTGQTDKARQTFLTWLELYLCQYPSTDNDLSHIVRQQLWPYRHPWLAKLWRFVRSLVPMHQKL